MFSYIWRTGFVDQHISAALQYFIIILFCHIFFLYQKLAACAIWILHLDLLGLLISLFMEYDIC